MMDAIEVHGVTRFFGHRAVVDNISFRVAGGEIFGFLGPNGAGKTTTIRMLTGLLRPNAGSTRVAGWDIVTERDEMKPCIGVVFEYQNIYPRLSARANLAFSAGLYGAARSRIDVVLDQVGLSERANDRAQNYSNGMKQRLLIARALLHEPKILFLDEPTRGLDPNASRSVRSVIRELANDGVTIFLTTHYMEEADRLCGRVAILKKGNIVCGKPDELKERYGGNGATLEDVIVELSGSDLYRQD